MDSLAVATENAVRICPGKSTCADASIGEGAGRRTASTVVGTRIHTQYAVRAPTVTCNGFRRSRTISTAALNASVVSISTCNTSALIVEIPDQSLEVFDILLAQLLVLAEVGHEGRDAAAEQTIEEAMAFARQPLVAGQHG